MLDNEKEKFKANCIALIRMSEKLEPIEQYRFLQTIMPFYENGPFKESNGKYVLSARLESLFLELISIGHDCDRELATFY